MRKLSKSLMALGVAAMMTLTACSSTITGVTIQVPETMEKGATAVATPEYAYSGATPEQAKIDELVDKLGLSYSSSDPNVVMVDEHGNLVAVNAGTAEVALSSEDGEIASSQVITVVVTPTGISMPDSLTLSMGDNENASITATVEPADATDYTVTYTSSDEDVVTVDGTGYVTAIADGTADITAEVDGLGLSATCHVTVTPAIESLAVSDDSITLSTGDTETLSLSVEPEEIDTSSATWTSSDESVATVSADGTVTAVAEGEATITATLGKVEATCDVTVSDKTYTSNSGSGSSSSGSSNNSEGSGNASSDSAGSSAPAVSTASGALPFESSAATGTWWSIDYGDYISNAVLENINAYRAAVGVAPLVADSGLSDIANSRCKQMKDAFLMSHDGAVTDEIIAQNWNSAKAVVDAWAASPGHYAAMIDPNYTVCGIGCWFEGIKGHSFWCVTFQ